MQILIHDDACHLHKYAQRRMEARDVLFCTLFYSAFLLYFPSCFIDPISLLLFGRIQQQLLRFLLQLCGSSATLFTCKVMWTSGAKGRVIRDCPSTRRHCPGLGPACVNSLSHGYLHTSTKRSIWVNSDSSFFSKKWLGPEMNGSSREAKSQPFDHRFCYRRQIVGVNNFCCCCLEAFHAVTLDAMSRPLFFHSHVS